MFFFHKTLEVPSQCQLHEGSCQEEGSLHMLRGFITFVIVISHVLRLSLGTENTDWILELRLGLN